MSYLIGGFYFVYFALIGVHIIFVPKILTMVGHAPVDIGIIFAAAPLVRFAIPFLFLRGFHLNQKTFFTALTLIAIGAVGFYPSLSYFWPLLFINILFGIGVALTLPYIEVIALETIGSERYGRIRLFGSIGFIGIALVVERFLSSAQIGIVFLITMAAFTAIIGALIGVRSTGNDHQTLAHESSPFRLSPHNGLWIGFFLMQVSFGPFYNFYTIYATDHGVSLQTTVWLWSFGVIAEIIMFYFQGPLLRNNLARVIQFTAFVTAIRWLIVALFPDSLPLMFIAQTLHAFSFALFHSASIALLFHLYSARKLSQQFFYGISYGLGGFIGALGAGMLYQYAPFWLFIGASAASFAAAIAFTSQIQKHRVSSAS